MPSNSAAPEPDGSVGRRLTRTWLIAIIATVAVLAGALTAFAVSRHGGGVEARHAAQVRPTTTVSTSTTTTTTSTTTTTTPPPTVPPTTVPPTTAPPSPSSAYAASRRNLPRGSIASALTSESGVPTYVSGTGQVATVWQYQGGRFAPANTVRLDYLVNTGLTIQIGDVTADGRPDFIVPIQAASVVQDSVVSKVGGDWHVVPFNGGSYPFSVVWVDLSITGGRLSSMENDCVPNCAEGTTRQFFWHYDPGQGGHFERG